MRKINIKKLENALAKKTHHRWRAEGSGRCDSFTVYDRLIPVVQLKELTDMSGKRSLMIGYYNDLSGYNLLKREILPLDIMSLDELVDHILKQFYLDEWDTTPEYYETELEYSLHCASGGHFRLTDMTDEYVRRRFSTHVMEWVPDFHVPDKDIVISSRTIFRIEIPAEELAHEHTYDLQYSDTKPVEFVYQDTEDSTILLGHLGKWSIGISGYYASNNDDHTDWQYDLTINPSGDGFYFFFDETRNPTHIPFKAAWVDNTGLDKYDCEEALVYWLS